MPAEIVVTDALANSGPNPIRFTRDTDLYVPADVNYPLSYGNLATNDVTGLRIRVFSPGCAINNSVAGQGEQPSTQAVAINLYKCALETYGIRIGDSAKFMKAVSSVAQTDSNGNPIYSTIPGPQSFRSSTFCGFQVGLQAHGDDMTLRDVIALRCGGGAVSYKAIGIDLWGHRQVGFNTSVQQMIKGPNDLEIMAYHLEDAGGSFYARMQAKNNGLIANSFGVWFNSTDQFRAIDFDFDGWDWVLSGETVADGWARGKAQNYTANRLNQAGLTLEMT